MNVRGYGHTTGGKTPLLARAPWSCRRESQEEKRGMGRGGGGGAAVAQ